MLFRVVAMHPNPGELLTRTVRTYEEKGTDVNLAGNSTSEKLVRQAQACETGGEDDRCNRVMISRRSRAASTVLGSHRDAFASMWVEARLRARAGVGVLVGILLVGILALSSALSSVATAEARSVRLSGGVVGDANAELKFKIRVRNGQPRRVQRFRYLDLDTQCTDGTSREFSRQLVGRPRITRLGITRRFTFAITSTPPSGLPNPNLLFVSGKMQRNVRRVRGVISITIRFPSSNPSGETACVSDGLHSYTVRR
jgi:hypothetical protein